MVKKNLYKLDIICFYQSYETINFEVDSSLKRKDRDKIEKNEVIRVLLQ